MFGFVPDVAKDLKTYTLDSFEHGQPETLFQADLNPKVLVIWQHGDETLGPRVGYHMYKREPQLLRNVDYVCGNPIAAARRPATRDTSARIVKGYEVAGTDLNRSYTPDLEPQSYEQRRATWIKKLIEANDYDYVIDLHTTFTAGGRYFIIAEKFLDEPAVRRMIAASPISNVVALPENIARDALNGNVPNCASIEYSRPLAGRIGVQDTIILLHGLVSGHPEVQPKTRRIYRVANPIPRDQDPGPAAKNFELCADGYYPILFGAKGYRNDPTKTYLGFAATHREELVI